MKWKFWEKDEDAVKREIEDIDVKLATLDPHTQGAEYKQLLEIRGVLLGQANEGWVKRIDPNTVLRLGGTLGIVVAIMVFEAYGHIFTSKATMFIPKPL